MGSPICFGCAIFNTLCFINALKSGEGDRILFHSILTAFAWGIFYSSVIK